MKTGTISGKEIESLGSEIHTFLPSKKVERTLIDSKTWKKKTTLQFLMEAIECLGSEIQPYQEHINHISIYVAHLSLRSARNTMGTRGTPE